MKTLFRGFGRRAAAVASHLGLWQQAWRADRRRAAESGPPPAELDFLPAALEVQERPPHPAARATAGALVLFFTAAVAWASIGKVDIVAVARGQIVPSGRVKLVQPLEIGIVRRIHVEEGQAVRAGEVLIELDPTDARADMTRLSAELTAARLELARTRALVAATAADPPADTVELDLPPSTSAPQQAAQYGLYRQQLGEFRARLAVMDNQIRRRRAELAETREQIAKLAQTLPIVAKRAQALKTLTLRKMAAESAYLELEQDRIERTHELAAQQHRRDELKASLEETRAQRRATRGEFRKATMSTMLAAQKQVRSLQQELVKAQQRNAHQRLLAPVDGVVQQLAVHTVGGVVTPAQELMRIVPLESRIEVQAWLENKDVGFVREGQSATVKVDTFPFTKYGALDADVLDISNDAVLDDKQGLAYAMRLGLQRPALRVGNRTVNLTPGMAVTVEVKTGQRRLIEFFLDPLLKYRDESLRER